MSEIRVDNITDEEGTGSPNIIYDNAASGLTATSIKGAIDEVSEQAVNSQELLAGVSEAADIDEAVSFIGRGAIVESSSNSNGHYVRWENGFQFSWRKVESTDWSDEGSFARALASFPADFDTSQHINIGWSATDNNDASTRNAFYDAKVLAQENGQRWDIRSSTGTFDDPVTVHAVGFWK